MTRRRGIRLAARDALHIFVGDTDPDAPPPTMVSFYVFDARAGEAPIRTREDAVTWIGDRLHRTPALTRRLHRVPADLDFPYWVETDVDPDDHVRYETIGPTSRSGLHRLLASMKERRLDLSVPPWEVHVLTDIRGVDDLPEVATIVALLLHHSVTDGLGAVEIARALFDDPAAAPSSGGRVVAVPGTVGAAAALPFRYARMLPALVATRRARRALGDLTASGEIVAPRPQRPRTRFDTDAGGPWQLGVVRMRLPEVRAVARATDTSVNDVILTIVSGGLRSYLASYEEIPAVAPAAIVPGSIRDRAGAESENKVTLMYVDLHIDRADPRERLHSVHESAALEKQRIRRPESAASAAAVDASPAFDLAMTIRRAHRRRVGPTGDVVPLANTTVTNVPRGPAEGLRFGDSPAVEAIGTPMLNRNYGLVHSVTSLGEVLTLSFLVSDSCMSDPGQYERHLAEAFAELARECLLPGARTVSGTGRDSTPDGRLEE